MRIDTVVQASADVITIVNLRAGDVYKRLEKTYDKKYKAHYGVVQSVDNNGTDVMITGIEWAREYTTPSATTKVFGTESDVKLFSATPDELKVHIDDLLDALRTEARDLANKQLKTATALEDLIRLQSELNAGVLTVAVTETKSIDA